MPYAWRGIGHPPPHPGSDHRAVTYSSDSEPPDAPATTWRRGDQIALAAALALIAVAAVVGVVLKRHGQGILGEHIVLVRPDFYVYAATSDLHALDDLVVGVGGQVLTPELAVTGTRTPPAAPTDRVAAQTAAKAVL